MYVPVKKNKWVFKVPQTDADSHAEFSMHEGFNRRKPILTDTEDSVKAGLDNCRIFERVWN